MKAHIIRAILYQDMSVKWKDAEQSGDVNVHLNVHQKTRQFVEAELDDFLLSDGEAILASFEKTIDGEIHHENPSRMEIVDVEQRLFRLQIPTLVHNTPGEWGVQFFVVTDYDPITGNYTEAYPFDKVKFSEHSSFIDDGLTVPTSENLSALYAQISEDGKRLIEEASIAATASAEQAAQGVLTEYAETVCENVKQTTKNKNRIDMLIASGIVDNQFYEATVEDAFITRQTAGGLTVVDPSPAIVEKIQGATVKTTNLFNHNKIVSSATTFVNCTEYTLSDDKTSMTARGADDEGSDEYRYALGWVTPLKNQNAMFLKKGTVYLSAYFTLVEKGSKTAGIQVALYGAKNVISSTRYTISATRTRRTWTFTIDTEGYYYPVFMINANKVTIDNIQVAYEDVSYRPYFEGLKHAYFEKIVSTGRNLYDKDTARILYYNLSEIEVSEDKNVIIARGAESDNQNDSANSKGWIRIGAAPNAYNVGSIPVMNGQIYISADITLIEQGSYNPIFSLFPAAITNASSTISQTISTTKKRYVFPYTIADTKGYGYMQFIAAFNSNKVRIENVQLSYVDTPYEPYTANEFALSAPVELPKWDYIAPQTGKVVRKIRQLVLTGTETNWGVYRNNENGGYVYSIAATGKKIGFRKSICNMFEHYDYAWDKGVVGQYSDHSTMPSFYFVTEYETLSAWKAHLAELYAAGTPVIVEYELETPMEEDIETPTEPTAHNGGSETVIQGATDNSSDGAILTTTNKYYVLGGEPDESEV